MTRLRNVYGAPILFGALTVFFLLIMVAPLSRLFVKAFLTQDGSFAGLANYAKYFETPSLSISVVHTLEVSVIVAALASVLGFLYAYALTRTNMLFKRAFLYFALLPVFMPTVVHALGLIYLFGAQGVVTQQFGIDIGLYGRTGIIIAEIIYTFPQAFLMFYVSLLYADGRLYEACDAMGVSPARKFFGITLPGVRYTAVSVAFICFTLCFTDFGVPKVIGGSYGMVAMDVYKQVAGQFNMNMGAVVGSILLAPAVLSYIVDRFVGRKEDGGISSKATALKIPDSRGRDAAAFVFCAAVALCFFALIAALLMGAFSDYYPYKTDFTLRHFSFDRSTGGIQSFANSVLMSFLTAVIGTAFVFLYAWLIEKTRGLTALKHIARFLSSLPVALPGMVIGLSFIFFFNTKENPFHFIYGTVWILVLAGVLHFYSVPYITASSALKKLDKEFESVAESLRVPMSRAVLRVSVPLCLPAILEILIYYFVYSMVTVSAVVFLYSADFKVAAIAITHMEEAGNYAQAAAMSLLILLTNVGIRVAYEIVTGRLRRKNEKRSALFDMEAEKS